MQLEGIHMKLTTKLIEKLPPLVWIAECKNSTSEIMVFHGHRVETGKTYCVAAVWDDDFTAADFDKTDIIAGTGIRIRKNKVIFVTPGNTLDRIVYYNLKNGLLVSNSLPAIFAFADIEPLKEYDYQKNFETIIKGLHKFSGILPTSKNNVFLTYFNNLCYDGNTLVQIQKPDCAPHFHSFDEYNRYLFKTASRVAENARDSNRKTIIEIVSTCSSGYDSSLATVIGKHMGSKKVLSIANARSLFKRPDSGEKVAAALGLPCELKNSKQKNYKNEVAIWVSMGDALDLHLTVFDFPKPLSLMLTAFHGDMMWERTPFDLTEFLHRHDPSGASFNEWGLHEGVIHMSIGFWAIRRGNEIQHISTLDEMKQWTLFNNYDRPIPRRIIEGAGVHRGDFAYEKRVAAIASDWLPNPWPYSKNLRFEFKQFANSQGIKIPSSLLVRMWRIYNSIDWHILRKIGLALGNESRFRISWAPFKNRWIFFYWTMHILIKRYKKIMHNI